MEVVWVLVVVVVFNAGSIVSVFAPVTDVASGTGFAAVVGVASVTASTSGTGFISGTGFASVTVTFKVLVFFTVVPGGSCIGPVSWRARAGSASRMGKMADTNISRWLLNEFERAKNEGERGKERRL